MSNLAVFFYEARKTIALTNKTSQKRIQKVLRLFMNGIVEIFTARRSQETEQRERTGEEAEYHD